MIRFVVSIPDTGIVPQRTKELKWKAHLVNLCPSGTEVRIAHFDELAHHHIDLDPPLHYYEASELDEAGLRKQYENYAEELARDLRISTTPAKRIERLCKLKEGHRREMQRREMKW